MKTTRKRYTISISVRSFWLIFLPIVIIVLTAGGLFGFLAVDRYVMPGIAGVTRDSVNVPDIRGMSHDEGREQLFGVGLLTEVRSREFDNEVADGAIISQFPEPGELVKKGRRIAVTISRGTEVGIVPAVLRMGENDARAELRGHGFTVGNVRRVYSGARPGTVIDVSPPPGTETSRAIDVVLSVSRGSRPTHTAMPNVVGDMLSVARKKIEDAGLKVTVEQRASQSPPGTVISQSVPPGSNVSIDGRVNIVVSTR